MFYRTLLRPLLFSIDPETAHKVVMRLAALGSALNPVDGRHTENDVLNVEAFGLRFPNPVGLAAGLDKEGEAVAFWQKVGFGFVEVGTVTPEPQPGNPKPRIFRLRDREALINRMGFNSGGIQSMALNLAKAHISVPIGVNIGKNKETLIEGAEVDYVKSTESLARYADYFAINVSSPNTPSLRDLQSPSILRRLVELVVSVASLSRLAGESRRTPVLVKISPDLGDTDMLEAIDAALEGGAEGIIATNTTISRNEIVGHKFASEIGGLSGKPLRERANSICKIIFRHTEGKIPIIGVGGMFSAEDAYERICSGATLVQLYTGLIYEGPGLVNSVNKGIAARLSRDGLISLQQAVGRNC